MSRRTLEIIPGALVWGTFLVAILLSFVRPLWAIYFIIVFDLLWLFRVLYFVFYLFVSWRRYRRTTRIIWRDKLSATPRTKEIYHLIFLPMVRESLAIVHEALESIRRAAYDPQKFIIVLAGEERASQHFREVADSIKVEYQSVFYGLVITVHPADLEGELAGKGSNLHFAGLEVQRFLDEHRLPYQDVIASSFDIDTLAHPEYFAHLTYLYSTVPNPTRASYQPVALYANTIWDAPSPVRIAAFGTTFWLLTELARPERLFTFSSHSMSFKMLVDVGFWEPDVVSEDSRIFLQGLFHYHGDYRLVPVYLPVSMDTVYGESYLKHLVALYRQQRRWAWGVEHFPYMVERFRRDREFPRRLKWKYLWNHLEGMYTWATAPILIFILGWLPLLVARGNLGRSVLVQNAPFTLEWLMRLAMVGVLLSGILSLTLLPHPPEEKARWHWFWMLAQWMLLPITFVIFGAFPAIDAQTRLMFGKYLGFNVTAKRH